jgi:hypothetical protein
MSFDKVAKNIVQTIFVKSFVMQIPILGKSIHKVRAISVIFNELPEVTNHQLGDNSPNRVTLIPSGP